jgi:hypothetical protein
MNHALSLVRILLGCLSVAFFSSIILLLVPFWKKLFAEENALNIVRLAEKEEHINSLPELPSLERVNIGPGYGVAGAHNWHYDPEPSKEHLARRDLYRHICWLRERIEKLNKYQVLLSSPLMLIAIIVLGFASTSFILFA